MAEIEAAASGAEQQQPRPQLSDFSVYEDGIVWNASLVLLNHFRTKGGIEWKGRRVVELGSGLGHLAWGLYKLGAHVTCTDTPLGDLESLRKRIARWLAEEEKSGDRGEHGSIRVVELTWGQEHWSSSPLSQEKHDDYDTIILAEVFSIPDLHEQLLWSTQQFVTQSVEIWSIFMNRPFSFMFFTHLADAGGFRVKQLDYNDVDMCGMDDEELGIFAHRVTYDPNSPRVLAKVSP